MLFVWVTYLSKYCLVLRHISCSVLYVSFAYDDNIIPLKNIILICADYFRLILCGYQIVYIIADFYVNSVG